MAIIDVYKCNKCGAVYPSDYFEQYGRKYGKGIGRPPVCEALSSKYHRPLVIDKNKPHLAAFPLNVCKGQMSLTTADEQSIETMILADNDRNFEVRAPIMQLIQTDKSPELTSHLKTVVASYKAVGRPVPSHLAKI